MTTMSDLKIDSMMDAAFNDFERQLTAIEAEVGKAEITKALGVTSPRNPLLNQDSRNLPPNLLLKSRKPSAAEQERAAAAFDEDEDGDDHMAKNFDDAVRKIQDRKGKIITKTAAMREARQRHPELYAKFQEETPALIAKAAPAPVTKSIAITRFEDLVDRVQSRDNCSRLQALTKAAREYPTEREAYSTALA
jgi:hypothetical protein